MAPAHDQRESIPSASGKWSERLAPPHWPKTDSSSLVRRGEGIDFAALRRIVTIRQVLELLKWEPAMGNKNSDQLRGPCPVHKSTSPDSRSLSVHLERNIYRCFKCDSKGNQLDLYAAVTGLPIYQAALELCGRLEIEPPGNVKRVRV